MSVIFRRTAGTVAQLLAPAGRVLDVGAGAAPWSIALALADPAATVTALDLPSVLPVTRAEVQAAGLANRFTFSPADILTSPIEPGGYDLILWRTSATCSTRRSTAGSWLGWRTAWRPAAG
jgi:methylase of polypeptide subunit release factors